MVACLCLGPQILSAEARPGLNGIWSTDGYGFVLDIRDGSAHLMSIGGSYCVSETTAPVPLDDLLPGSGFHLAPDGQSLTISFPLEPHRIRADRLPRRPSACDTSLPDTPRAVFETAVGFFEANYPFLHLYDVDWPNHAATVRRRIYPEMPPEELLDALSRLLRPVRDGHVSLVAGIDGARHVFAANRGWVIEDIGRAAAQADLPPAEAISDFRKAFWHESLQSDLLGTNGQMIGNDRIQYGMIAEETGYIAFLTIGGFGAETLGPQEDLAATQKVLDLMLGDLARTGATALIIDLSLSFGGDDYIAREIASRFFGAQAHAYTKHAADAVAPIETRVTVSPSARRRFPGEVYLLTSNVTVSAAEVLTMALRTQPHVTHLGEPTRGALSDVFSHRLPNGWQLNLSNEVYLDAEGRHWEAAGIPPDVDIPVFTGTAAIESHKLAISRVVRRVTGRVP